MQVLIILRKIERIFFEVLNIPLHEKGIGWVTRVCDLKIQDIQYAIMFWRQQLKEWHLENVKHAGARDKKKIQNKEKNWRQSTAHKKESGIVKSIDQLSSRDARYKIALIGEILRNT